MTEATADQVERSNLLSIFKATLKNLLDSCLPHHSSLSDENPCIRQLFIILQNIICHLLQDKFSLSLEARNVWSLLERVAIGQKDMQECILNIREMSNVRTPLGKLRVWLHIALMQKKLSDHFNHLLAHHTLLREYYQPLSIMLTEDAAIISGLLSSLNFLDYVFISKDEDFDLPLQPINYFSYISSNMAVTPKQDSTNNGKCNTGDDVREYTELVSQKRYLEEVNKSLSTRLNYVDKSVLDLTASNSLLKEELFESRKNMVELQREVGGVHVSMQENLKSHTSELEDKDSQLEALRKQLQDVKAFNLSEISRNAELQDSVSHKEGVLARVEEKCQQFTASITSLEALNEQLEQEKCSLSDELDSLRHELVSKETHIYKLTREVEMEKGRRAVLEGLMEDARIKSIESESRLKVASQIKKDNEQLQQLLNEYTRVKKEQEQALEEIGSALSQTKLQVNTLEEGACEGVTWVDDDSVTQCFSCNKAFSVSRRKHHCRRCGHIFCGDCSNHKASLPNHPRPSRVCFDCHTGLQNVL